MKVKTDYSKCAYITAGKVYSIELDSDGDHTIIDDVGEKIWIVIDKVGCPHLRGNNWVVVSDEKPFDITQHEWSDGDIQSSFITNDKERLNFNFDSSIMPMDVIGFNRVDAVVIAKALGVTAEDLK